LVRPFGSAVLAPIGTMYLYRHDAFAHDRAPVNEKAAVQR